MAQDASERAPGRWLGRYWAMLDMHVPNNALLSLEKSRGDPLERTRAVADLADGKRVVLASSRHAHSFLYTLQQLQGWRAGGFQNVCFATVSCEFVLQVAGVTWRTVHFQSGVVAVGPAHIRLEHVQQLRG